MTTIDEAVKRTVRRFSEKGITLEEKEIGKRLNKLTVFGVPVAEAERTIAAAVARENGITLYDGQHTGASVRDIRDLAVEEWATIEGRVVSLSVPQSPGIHSQGIIADRTGAIQFTAWNRKRDTDTMIPDIQVGKWYRFSNGVIRDYKGCPVYNIHSGSDVVELDDMGNIPEIVTPIGKMSVGVVTIKGKVTRIFPPKSEKVKQRGVIGDATGTTLYTIWVSDAPEFVLEEGQSYVLHNVICTEYDGSKSVTLNRRCVETIDEEISVLDRNAPNAQYTGVIVQIKDGSGLVHRCPVEGCNRVLTQQDFCKVHELQESYREDIRIKAVIDDGQTVKSVIFSQKATEAVTGISLAQAVAMGSTSPRGVSDIIQTIHAKIFGRYFTVYGTEFPDLMYVSEAKPVDLSMEQAHEMLKVVG